MIAEKKLFYKGFGLIIGFFIVLVAMFMPLFGGQNALNYMDNLYNSISKGSAYYIPAMIADNNEYKGKQVEMELAFATENQAKETAALFQAGGAEVTGNDLKLFIKGDIGSILDNCLSDSDIMFANNGDKIKEKYGYAEKQVMFNWWTALEKTDMALKKQKKFAEAKFVTNVKKKAVECSYNYYEIEPQKIMDKIFIVTFSLVFYVVYTLWFGFSIMFMFEGWGMRLEH